VAGCTHRKETKQGIDRAGEFFHNRAASFLVRCWPGGNPLPEGECVDVVVEVITGFSVSKCFRQFPGSVSSQLP